MSEKDELEWSPPTPPWDPEPEALDLGSSEEPQEAEPVGMGLESTINQMVEDGDLKVGEPEEEVQKALEGSGSVMPVVEPPQTYNGKPVSPEFSEFNEEDNGIEINGFFFYMVQATTGITLNGVHYPAGGYWFDEETYNGIEIIDSNAAK